MAPWDVITTMSWGCALWQWVDSSLGMAPLHGRWCGSMSYRSWGKATGCHDLHAPCQMLLVPWPFTKLSTTTVNPPCSDIGGSKEQIEKMREVVELPMLHPEKFVQLGIDPPKVSQQ